MDKKIIIEQLKESCIKRKISASQLARELGYSISYISSIFGGDNKYEPSDSFTYAASIWLSKCWVCKRAWNCDTEGAKNG